VPQTSFLIACFFWLFAQHFNKRGNVMKLLFLSATLMMSAMISPVEAQDTDGSGQDDQFAGYDTRNSNQNQNRPVIGLTHKADSVVVTVSFSSDSRDAAVRKQEIHNMLSAALDRACAAGVELGSSAPNLKPVTKSNYQSLPLGWAGREDTSKADIFVKVPLSSTVEEVDKRIDAFVKALPRTGRGTIIKSLGRQLVIRKPEQYRAVIVSAIADDVRRNAAAFGPEYRGAIDGVDKPVLWTQANETEVFLYLPYSYRIIAK
jgi:hypothetical protein